MSFKNKVAVVTGGARGIGLAIVTELAKQGAHVAIVSRRTESAAAAEAQIKALAEIAPDQIIKSYGLDVADYEAVQAAGKTIIADFGSIDILINNAGVTKDGLLMRMKEADWDVVLDTNLKGAFNTIKAFQRSIMKSDQGRIINVASVIGLMGNAGQANYAASKAGLIGLTKSVAKELSSRKVTCNALAPGFIQTDMTDVLSDEQKAGIATTIPLSELGETSDIAQAALYLASAGAKYVTGQVLAVDGGMTM